MTEEEKERYARQIILPQIGEEGQNKIKKAKVLVVGAGGLGSPVLQYLVGAGIGKIGIIDGDVVSLSNLPRQTLYSFDDIDSLKAEVAEKYLNKLNSHCKIQSYSTFLTEDNVTDLFKKYDIIVDCTDNFKARYLIDSTALQLKKTWVYGSVLEYSGQVSVFDGAKGQSYKSLFPEENHQKPVASNFGVLGVLPGIIGCLQANEVIKLICNIGETLSGKLLIYDIRDNKQQVFEI